MECEDCTPSLAQAIKMKRVQRDGKLSAEVILSIMQEEKPNQREKPAFSRRANNEAHSEIDSARAGNRFL